MDEYARPGVEASLRRFVKHKYVRDRLLDVASNGGDITVSPTLKAIAAEILDLSAIPVDFDPTISIFANELVSAIEQEAAQSEGHIFNRFVQAGIGRPVTTFA